MNHVLVIFFGIIALTNAASPSHCPISLGEFGIGNACPEEDSFTYYKCCGQEATECCGHLKVDISFNDYKIDIAL